MGVIKNDATELLAQSLWHTKQHQNKIRKTLFDEHWRHRKKTVHYSLITTVT